MLLTKCFIQYFFVKWGNVLKWMKYWCHWKHVEKAAGLTFISGVHPLSQQETAELFLSQLRILDFHQVWSHAERKVV